MTAVDRFYFANTLECGVIFLSFRTARSTEPVSKRYTTTAIDINEIICVTLHGAV